MRKDRDKKRGLDKVSKEQEKTQRLMSEKRISQFGVVFSSIRAPCSRGREENALLLSATKDPHQLRFQMALVPIFTHYPYRRY